MAKDNQFEVMRDALSQEISSYRDAARKAMGVGQRPYGQVPVPPSEVAEFERFMQETGGVG